MRKISIFRRITVLSFACALLLGLSGCRNQRINLSKNMLVANITDVTVTSVNMDVDDDSLDSPIELLDAPLKPGEARAVTFSVPKKQAEKGNWLVLGITEEGEDLSSAFEIGEFNPHGDAADISCFSVYWNEEREHYSIRVYFNGSEANEGIYAPGEEPNNPGDDNPDDVNPDDDNPDDINPDNDNPNDVNPDDDNPDDINPVDDTPGGQSDEPVTVIIDGVDVSSELQIKEIDEVHFAKGESFIESLADEEMHSREFRYFNFEYIPENREIYVSSWFTDSAVCSLFIDSTEVYEYTDEGYRIIQISEAPRMIDGEVYIPMEAFAVLTNLEIEIR